MTAYHITQTLRGPHGWRSVRSATTARGAAWDAADMCNRDEYGSNACKPHEVRTVTVEAATVAEAFEIANARTYRTELTPEGEQAVIPGCERNASDRAKQLDLF